MFHALNNFGPFVSVKKVNDVTRLQALFERKKVVITKATIRDALRLDDAEGIDYLPNEEIFTELARMGYEKPSTKLTFYKAFFSQQWKFLIHTILYCMSAKRTSWNEFSSSMASAVICHSTVDEVAAEVNVDNVSTAGVADEGAASIAYDVIPTTVDEQSIPSPTPPTQSPPPLHDIPSTSQVQPTPPPSLIAQPPLPQQQPQLSQDAKIIMDLLYNLFNTCTTLTRQVENLGQDKIAQALEITKLKQRVKKLERRNKLKVSKLKRLKKDVADIAIEVVVDAEIKESTDVQGRQVESQAQIYHNDLENADKEVYNMGLSIPWQCKKQIVVATSSTEAEYVAAASCCA
nr:hypothetical protein [Tanacetum cinerariifolium]